MKDHHKKVLEKFDEKFPDLPKARENGEVMKFGRITNARIRDIKSFLLQSLTENDERWRERIKESINFNSDNVKNDPYPLLVLEVINRISDDLLKE